jgi:hypothetical protein
MEAARFAIVLRKKLPTCGALIALGLLPLLVTPPLLAQANMRIDAALSLYLGSNGSNDNHGIYSACMDSSNGFAYFGATYAYKVDVRGAVPRQVGNGVSLGHQASSVVMDPTAGCAYFASGMNIVQIMANGTNAPSLGASMNAPFGFSPTPFTAQLLLDDTDPANHYLYVMTDAGTTNSTLYKIALNQFPNSGSIVGSASINPGEPAMYYGAIDLTNRFAYYGTFIAVTGGQVPYITKFALGSGANPPVRVGGVALDTTERSVGGIALDIANGYGYCSSDGDDANFGGGRVYKWALNGTNAPVPVSYVDMHTNEGYSHEAFIRPDRGLLYFGSDLSYPGQIYRFRLPPGTNAPVETGALSCDPGTNTMFPAWGTNPTNNSYWGEVFLHCVAYDSVRDFVYFGRDHADGQLGFYTNEILKTALDRDEMLVALTKDVANTNNSIPYRESFESYTNGFSLVGINGWSGEDAMMGVVIPNNYAYVGDFPIPGPHQFVLQVDGAVTNRFRQSTDSNVLVDMVVQGKYWTDPALLTLSNTPFAFCVTTNGHLAVWNCTNPPSAGNGWTELLDTTIASNQFTRVTLEAAYNRDANGEFYYRVWVNGAPSANPQTWYAAADSSQNYFGDLLTQGHFALDDLVVTAPMLTLSNVTRNANGSVSLLCQGIPGLTHRVWATTNLSSPASWQFVSTNVAGADGSWQYIDTNAPNYPSRFYRASLP